MSEILQVTYRKAGVEYHQEESPSVGAWNSDASPGTLGKFDFSEIRNLRQVSIGSLTCRTAPKLYQIPGFDGNGTVIAKCQYRTPYRGNPDCQLDVSLVFTGDPSNGKYYLVFVDPATSVTNDPFTTIVHYCGEFGQVLLTGWMTQFKLSLTITLRGHSPTNGVTDTTGGTWSVFSDNDFGTGAPTYDAAGFSIAALGKDVCPTPTKMYFVQKTQGDLFVVDNNGDTATGASPSLGRIILAVLAPVTLLFGHNTGNGKNTPFLSTAKTDPSDPPNPALLPLPLNCDYWLNEIGLFDVNKPFYWIPGSTDANADAPEDTNQWLHTMSRAWGYRFVAVIEYTDPRGDKYRVRTQPSVDMWVPDVTYGPAQWGPHPMGGSIDNPSIGDSYIGPFHLLNGVQWASEASDSGHEWIGINDVQLDATNGGRTYALPDVASLQSLQTEFRKAVDPTPGDQYASDIDNPYYWTAAYLGFVRATSDANFAGTPPYLTAVPASRLKKAPMTIFNWVDFFSTPARATSGTLDGVEGKVVAIEIFRTVHSEPNDKDNAKKNPDFAPHSYHYVAKLENGGTFTDDLQDDIIASGADPSQYEGYLRGQFSGNVMTEYGNRLVMGDVVTDYKVLPPHTFQDIGDATYLKSSGKSVGYETTLAAVRGFLYKVTAQAGAGGYTLGELYPTDVTKWSKFWAAYVDLNGVRSDPVELNIDNYHQTDNRDATTDKLYLAFTLPRGYDPNIESVVLYRQVWDAGNNVWIYTEMATTRCDAGYYISKNDEQAGNLLTIPGGTVKRSDSRGAIIYSEPNQEFFWPPLNSWIVHSFAPVTALEAITGPLWVFTDQSVHLTDLFSRKEEETKYLGCVSRFAVAKVNKVVIFLSGEGLHFMEASGVRNLPHSVHTTILDYLQEEIPGVPRLANLRRAALGWMGERMELWLWLPSSKDLGGSLPHRLIVFRFASSGTVREARWMDSADFLSNIICYEFDLTQDFALTDRTKDGSGVAIAPVLDTSSFRSDLVVFNSHVDGGMFGAYFDKKLNGLYVIDNDDEFGQWPGSTALEKYWPMGQSMLRKAMTEVILRIDGSCNMTIANGQADSSSVRCATYGALDRRVKLSRVTDLRSPIRKRVRGASYETTSTAPLTRIVTIPDNYGNHTVDIQAIAIDVSSVNNHP